MLFEDLIKTMLEEDLKRLKDQELSVKFNVPIQSGSVR